MQRRTMQPDKVSSWRSGARLSQLQRLLARQSGVPGRRLHGTRFLTSKDACTRPAWQVPLPKRIPIYPESDLPKLVERIK